MGGITGPASFGGGGETDASSGIGDLVEIHGLDEEFYVPDGYTSGAALSDTSTWGNATFSSLGLTPGTYPWTWGSGQTADSYTLDIETAPVPEPASIAVFGIVTAMGLLLRRRRRAV